MNRRLAIAEKSGLIDPALQEFKEEKNILFETLKQEKLYVEQTEPGLAIDKLRKLQEAFGKNGSASWKKSDVDRFIERYFNVLDSARVVTKFSEQVTTSELLQTLKKSA